MPQGSVLRPVLFVLYTTPLSNVIERHSIYHHSFADDTQLRKSAPPHRVSKLVQSMQECIHDVKAWMSSNKLKLNDDKTETMIVSSQRMSTTLPMPDSLTVSTSNVMFSQSVKTLGVELRRINSIRHYLSVEATQKLVLAFVMSRLDYCNSLLYGCSQYLINLSTDFRKFTTMLRASS